MADNFRGLSVMKMRSAVPFFLPLLCGNVVFANDEEALFFRIAPETVSCIVEHRAVIEAQSNSIIYIHPPTCPQPLENPLSVFTTAEAPDITRHLSPDGAGPDRLIILGRAQLACFDSAPSSIGVQLWRFYPETCDFEPDL